MANLPPLNALRAFEAAARHLNFRRAAEELNVTQGAVAQHVRGLEASLGVQLFERKPRGLGLTEDGRRLMAPVCKAFTMLSDAVAEVKPERQTVKISVTPSFAARWLVPRLSKLSVDNPEFDVDIVATDTLANFQGDGIDIAVRQTRPPFPAGLTAELLFPSSFIPVCHPDFAGARIRNAPDLADHLLLQDAHGMWPLYFESLGSIPSSASLKTINFSQTHLAIDAAVAGQGVALAADVFVERELASGALIQPVEQRLESDLAFFIVHPRRPRKATVVSRVRDWLLAEGQ